MANLSFNEFLFRDDPVDRQAKMTHAGQAHFAGTGPGASCRECAFYMWKATGGWTSVNGKHGGAPKPACCEKFRQLTGGLGEKVPHDALSCKHFKHADAPQPLRRPE